MTGYSNCSGTSAMALIFKVTSLLRRTSCPSFFIFLCKRAQSRIWSSAVGDARSIKLHLEKGNELVAPEGKPKLLSLDRDCGETGGVGAISLPSSNELWTWIHQFVFTMQSSIHSSTRQASVFLLKRLPRCFKQSSSRMTVYNRNIHNY